MQSPLARRRLRLRHTLAGALVTLLLCGNFSAAHAAVGGVFHWLKFPTIEVANNNAAYIGVTAIGYGWEAEFSIDSGVVGRVKSWKVYPAIDVTGVGLHSLKLYAASKSYPVGNRPKHVHKTVAQLFPDVAVKNFAIQVCNQHRALLKNQGHSDHHVFNNEHKIATTVWGHIDIDSTQGAVFAESFSQDGLIVCKKWQGSTVPTAGDINAKPAIMKVTKAKLSISPAYQSTTANCPVIVPLVAEFEATAPGTLQFRFVSAHGKVSQTYNATIGAPTNGVYKTKFEKQISVPLPTLQPGNSGGQGGAINQTAGSGFATATPPVDPIFPSNPSPSGATQLQNQATPGNVHSESFRVEVLSPTPTIVSNYHGYHITCNPKQNPGIVMPTPTLGVQSKEPSASPGAKLKTAPASNGAPAYRK